ncbi:MAG TPA: phosphate ABC transporter substrate-binding protein PstS [Jatrophihabitans sp.]|nr:phosphate ABC transporter substrate-binding protein PstS [Jatrophihabitans sp.]
MLITRAGLIAGLVAGAVALTACGSDNNGSSTAAGGGSSSSGGASSSSTSINCASGSLKSDGSTAQQNAMDQWIKDYQSSCSGATVNYGGGGSGQGIKDFTNKQVDFAGSDAALDPTKGEVAAAGQACGGAAIDLPMVTGPIAVGYNLKGADNLVFTPDVLAKIFTGKITTWNDPAIKAINSGANLPATKITVFNRSDASGTTQNFERYLAASAPSVWTAKPDKTWAGTGQGKKGNQLVGQAVQATQGSIAYVEWSYAIQNNLQTGKIDNGAGAVELSADSAGKAVAAAKVAPNGPGDLSLKLDYATKTPGAYPIVLVTYEIVCAKYADSAKGSLVKSFMNYISSTDAQNSVHDLGYAALPQSVQTQVQAAINSIG